MVILNKDSENTVILELTSVSSLLAPYYTFELINDITPSNVTYFTGTDLSTYKCRYNRFNIIETGTTYVNLTASTINLKTGSYTYNVYEASASTISISATTQNIIATGILKVNGTDSDLPLVYR
jgi:hypothetical protein